MVTGNDYSAASSNSKPIAYAAVVDRIAACLKAEALPVIIKLWNQQTLAGPNPARVVLSVSSPRALRLLVKPTMSNLAEAYAHKLIDVAGNIRDVVPLFVRLAHVTGRTTRRLNPKWFFWRHYRQRDRRAVQWHYDISNDFYALWLDRRRVYSCAYFKTEGDTLDLAQEQKLDLICRKLQLKPGARFLDIGCGWGGLILWASMHYGVKSSGVTISRTQYHYVKNLIEESGLGHQCAVYLMDYRDLSEEEPFDRIASVGMFEHVGLGKLPLYFSKIHRLLKPGGIVMNHGITSVTFDDEVVAGSGAEFIERYVFPDGELTHLSRVLETMARQGLECLDVECLRPHYARTLWHWVERLEARQDQAQALIGDTKYRIWRAYLGGFAYSFEHGWVSIHQILAAKPPAHGSLSYPLAREHIYQ